jgi:hypothetical protein
VNGVPPRTYLSGKCTIPEPSAGWPANNKAIGAHVWLANLLYSEQIAWPLDTFVSETFDPNPDDSSSRDYFFSIPLFSAMESLSHFMSSGEAVCGGSSGASCPTLNADPNFRFTEAGYMTPSDPSTSQTATAFVTDPARYYFYWQSLATENRLSLSMMQGSASPLAGLSKHSWASFSAGHFVVMCNSWRSSTGSMVPSRYQTHVSMGDLEAGDYVRSLYDASNPPVVHNYVDAHDKRFGAVGTHWVEVLDFPSRFAARAAKVRDPLPPPHFPRPVDPL